MKIRCPFITVFDEVDCVYMEASGYCDEIDINTGNGDAWCHVMIDEGIRKNEIDGLLEFEL